MSLSLIKAVRIISSTTVPKRYESDLYPSTRKTEQSSVLVFLEARRSTSKVQVQDRKTSFCCSQTLPAECHSCRLFYFIARFCLLPYVTISLAQLLSPTHHCVRRFSSFVVCLLFGVSSFKKGGTSYFNFLARLPGSFPIPRYELRT